METQAQSSTLPVNGLTSFFNQYTEAQYTEKLWHFYKAHVHYTEMATASNAATDLVFYESLLRLLQNCRQLQLPLPEPIQLQPYLVEQTLVSLEGIVNLLKSAIPVGVIYNLSPIPTELDLMVVLEKGCSRSHQEFEHILDLSQLGFKKGACTVHSHGLLYKLLLDGHIFYNTACIASNIIYKKNNEELFVSPSPNLLQQTKTQAERHFKAAMHKAVQFYNGVQHYIGNGVNDMAVFMLQQACELTYRCLLNALRGKDVKCHSLVVLRKHLKRYAPAIIGIFSPIEEEELQYLKLLEEAYVKARYNENYTIAQGLMLHLNQSVGVLQQKANQLFKHQMEVLGHKINGLGGS